MGKFNVRIALACLAVAVGGVGLVTSSASSQSPAPQAVPAALPSSGTAEQAVVSWGQSWDYRPGSSVNSRDDHFTSLWVDTSQWNRGNAPFGWGEGEYRTDMPSPSESVSTYFRTEFQLPDVASLESVVVNTRADDGIVLYVNGVEIGRQNMHAGRISPTTYADSSVETDVQFEIPQQVLRWGRNVISAEVHANAHDTRAVSFDAEVIATFDQADDADRPLRTGQKWKHALQATEPAGDWNTSAKAVEKWSEGHAPLGWGSHSVATTLPAKTGYDVLYAHTSFKVQDLKSVTTARIKTVADDGVVVRVNGQEVGRANLPTGKLTPGTRALHSYHGTAVFDIPVAALTSGENIVTAEVHKAHSQSPTVLFDAQIELIRGDDSEPGSEAGTEDQKDSGDQQPPAGSAPEGGQSTPTDTATPEGEDQVGESENSGAGTEFGSQATPGGSGSKPSKPSGSQPGTSPQAPSDGDTSVGAVPGWGAPTWQDEFSGSYLDPSKWRVRDGDYLAYDQAVIQSENVKVKDGNLVITTDSLSKKVVFSDGRERYWSTGYVDTVGRNSQKYGRWEIRAKLPLSPGQSRAIWPAIWLRDSNGPGEIDIMEAFGGPHDKLAVEPEGAWGITVHESSASGSQGKRLKHSEMRRGEEHIGESWHTWALEWTPEGMDFFFDGKKVWSASAAEHPWLNTAFSEEGVDIRLNTQVGHSWGGYADPNKPHETKVPVDFLIDYVRVWEYQP